MYAGFQRHVQRDQPPCGCKVKVSLSSGGSFGLEFAVQMWIPYEQLSEKSACDVEKSPLIQISVVCGVFLNTNLGSFVRTMV